MRQGRIYPPCRDPCPVIREIMQAKDKGRSWIVREYDLNSPGVLLAEFNRNFNLDKKDKFWEWKYLNNPNGKAVIFVADAGGKIAGSYAIIPYYLKVGEKVYYASEGADAFTSPLFRKQGIFAVLGMEIIKHSKKLGMDLNFSFPIPAAMSGHRNAGCIEVGAFYTYFFRTGYGYLFKRILGDGVLSFLAGRAVSAAFRALAGLTGKSAGTGNIEVSVCRRFTGEHYSLWDRVSRDFTVIVRRDEKYMNWRFINNPDEVYTVLDCRIKGELAGYAILKFKDEAGVKTGCIADFLVSPGLGAEAPFIAGIVEHIRKSGAEKAIYSLFGGAIYSKCFEAAGFKKIDSELTAVVYETEKQSIFDEYLKDTSGWYFTLGDSDAF